MIRLVGTLLSVLCAVFLTLILLGTSPAAEETNITEIKGRVLSPRGLPLSGAEVREDIGRRESLVVRTDKSGEFLWKGRYCSILEASHPDWPGYKALIPRLLLGEDYVLLALRKTLTVKGKVQNPDSKPIAGAKITLEVYGVDSASGFARVKSLIADADGSFVIADIVPENRYRLVVYAKGFCRLVTDRFFASKSELRQFEYIVMSPGRAVTFTVLLPDGKPLPNVLVSVGGKDWPYGQGRTDSTGKVIIEDLTAEKVHAYVSAGEWRQKEYWYEPDQKGTVTIRLERKAE